MSRLPSTRTLGLLAVLAVAGVALALRLAPGPDGALVSIGSAEAMRRLPRGELRRGHPVKFQGVAVASDPDLGLLVVQDGAHGAGVEIPPWTPPLSPGDRIEVSGFTAIEDEAPVVVLATIRRLEDKGPLQCPRIPPERLADPDLIHQCVEIEVTFERRTQVDQSRLRVGFRAGDRQFEALTYHASGLPQLRAGESIVIRGAPVPTPASGTDAPGVRFLMHGVGSYDRPDRAEAARASDAGAAPLPGATLPPLTSVMEIKNLGAAEAGQARPVRLSGVATLISPPSRAVFVQTGEAAIYVSLRDDCPLPSAGDLVEVAGTTASGEFAPVVGSACAATVGRAPLPPPLPLELVARPFTARSENAWAELRGVVRRQGGDHVLAIEGGEIVLALIGGSPAALDRLVDGEVLARGVLSPLFHYRQYLGARLLVAGPESLQVLRQPPPDPFDRPLRTAGDLTAFSPTGTPLHRLRVRGAVTAVVRPGQFFIQDEDVGLLCEGDPQVEVRVGEEVEAVGFLPPSGRDRRLVDSLVRRAAGARRIVPVAITAAEMGSGGFDGRLVRVVATLRERRREYGRERLSLAAGSRDFLALLELPQPHPKAEALRAGSLLAVTGVRDFGPESHSFARRPGAGERVWLRSLDDVEVVRAASWWTRERALMLVGVLASLSAAILGWVATLRSRVARQTALIRLQLETKAELESRLLHSQKLESIGRLAGGVAHDFNNLLTGILGFTDILQRRADLTAPARQGIDRIDQAARQAAALTRQLLAYSRKQVFEPRRLNLSDVVREADGLLRRLLGERITIDSDLEPAPHPIDADPTQLQQVLLNLVVNARDAMPQGGRITIRTANVDLRRDAAAGAAGPASGPHVMVEVADTGEGMDPETQAHAFEPFYTTKARGRGTGLGLATVLGIVEQSGGHIGLTSVPGKGTSVRFYLPRAEGPTPREDPPTPPQAPLSASGTVLLVEDEAVVREVTEEILRDAGFDVLLAEDAEAALAIVSGEAPPLRLLITDVVLPGPLDGPALAREIALRQPGLPILFVSGYVESGALEGGVPDTVVHFLPKPFTAEQLLAKVASVIRSPGLLAPSDAALVQGRGDPSETV